MFSQNYSFLMISLTMWSSMKYNKFTCLSRTTTVTNNTVRYNEAWLATLSEENNLKKTNNFRTNLSLWRTDTLTVYVKSVSYSLVKWHLALKVWSHSLRSIFFLFRLDTFSEETRCTGKQTGGHNKSCLPYKTGEKSYMHPFP